MRTPATEAPQLLASQRLLTANGAVVEGKPQQDEKDADPLARDITASVYLLKDRASSAHDSEDQEARCDCDCSERDEHNEHNGSTRAEPPDRTLRRPILKQRRDNAKYDKTKAMPHHPIDLREGHLQPFPQPAGRQDICCDGERGAARPLPRPRGGTADRAAAGRYLQAFPVAVMSRSCQTADWVLIGRIEKTGQKRPDVSSAGNRREIIELKEEIAPRKRDKHAEREGCRTNAAARNGKCGGMRAIFPRFLDNAAADVRLLLPR